MKVGSTTFDRIALVGSHTPLSDESIPRGSSLQIPQFLRYL